MRRVGGGRLRNVASGCWWPGVLRFLVLLEASEETVQSLRDLTCKQQLPGQTRPCPILPLPTGVAWGKQEFCFDMVSSYF